MLAGYTVDEMTHFAQKSGNPELIREAKILTQNSIAGAAIRFASTSRYKWTDSTIN
jgi:hypothetical protein